jgi:hypothetical protein
MEAAALARARDAYEQRRAGDGPSLSPIGVPKETEGSPLMQSLRKLLARFRQRD